MLNGIKNIIRKVGITLGLIKDIESVSQLKGLGVNEDFYQNIKKWRSLYKGYYEPLHSVGAYTIDKGNHKRRMATMNIPKIVSNEMATIIFNERAEISISSGNDNQFEDLIKDVLKDNKFNSNFQNQLEYMFATGGLVIKPYYDGRKIKIGYVAAENIIPISWDDTMIKEAIFPSYSIVGDKHYTLLEYHLYDREMNRYYIKNELYQSDKTGKVGTKVALSVLYPDLEPIVYAPLTVQRPLFTYIRPNIANNIDEYSPLGISVFANSYDTIKTLDIMLDSFQREFRLGRKRIFVNESMIRTITDPTTGRIHRYFDPTDETYEAFGGGGMDASAIKESISALRVQEHIDAINAMLKVLSMQIGLSTTALSFDGESMKTATEVISEQSKTFKTKQSHENIIEQGLIDMIDIIAIIADGYGLINGIPEYEVSVFFDDSIAQDSVAELQEQIMKIGAGLQSKKRAIMKLNGLTDEEAIQLLQEIAQEQLSLMPTTQQIRSSILIGGDEE